MDYTNHLNNALSKINIFRFNDKWQNFKGKVPVNVHKSNELLYNQANLLIGVNVKCYVVGIKNFLYSWGFFLAMGISIQWKNNPWCGVSGLHSGHS